MFECMMLFTYVRTSFSVRACVALVSSSLVVGRCCYYPGVVAVATAADDGDDGDACCCRGLVAAAVLLEARGSFAAELTPSNQTIQSNPIQCDVM